MHDFHFVMGLNRASIGLMKACATGQHIKTATLSARKAGKGQQEYLTFKFHDVLISSYQTGGSEDAVVPTDSVSFNFAKLEVDYKPQKADGTLGTAIQFQVRPEGEQDLLARRDRPRSRGARPRRPPPRRPEPPRARARRLRSSSPGSCGTPATSRRRSRTASRPATSCSRRSPELPSYLRRLGDADKLAVLLRLFLLGVPVPRASMSSWARSCRRASRAPGFSSTTVRSTTGCAPRPSRRATDRVRSAGGAEAYADHVPGVHRPSVALAHLTVRGEGERALDLCTGNGIQAILLAAHAGRVVATDVNEQALAYAAFNAALNGVGNVETRPGSFFEPVEGSSSTLSSPIRRTSSRPRTRTVQGRRPARRRRLGTRRAGDAGRARARRVRRRPDRLGARPGRPRERPRSGWTAQAATRSCSTPRRTIRSRPRRRGIAIFSTGPTRTPMRSIVGSPTRELGIEQLGYACLVLRKRGDGPDGWLEAQQLPRARPAGRHVRRLFETHDRLAESTRTELLDRRPRVVDGAVVTQTRFAQAAGRRRR